VDALLIDMFKKSCNDCTIDQIESLNKLQQDIESRVLESVEKVVFADDVKEKIVLLLAEIEELDKRLINSRYSAVSRAIIRKINRKEKEIALLKKNGQKTTIIKKSESWDPSPEGERKESST
jgi:formaldehyde-activating enzyme involved in methanogenesis